jgi:hypothetical protein
MTLLRKAGEDEEVPVDRGGRRDAFIFDGRV